jgi:predicted acylesterase/phospholipase RssA
MTDTLDQYTNLAIDAGGIFGPIYVGALAALGDLNRFTRILGVSIGSMIGMMLILGYTLDEVGIIGRKMNFRKLISGNILDALRISKTGGRANIDKMMKVFGKHIANKCDGNPDITFGELYKITGRELIVVAANVCTNKPRYFNMITDTDMPVRLAVAMSSTIPLVFQYNVYENEYYYDGAFADYNLLDYFDQRSIDDAIAISLVKQFPPLRLTGIEAVVVSLVTRAAQQRPPHPRIIKLYASGVHDNLKKSPKRITGTAYNALFIDGYFSVKLYIDNYNSDTTDCSHA